MLKRDSNPKKLAKIPVAMSNLILKDIKGEGKNYPIDKVPFKIGRERKNNLVL